MTIRGNIRRNLKSMIEEKEIWKNTEYLGYDVSNYGRVRSTIRYVKHSKGGVKIINERILKTSINKKGYEGATFSIEGKFYYISIHRLVALAFIPNLKNKPQINHIDKNTANNHYKNLEWCTAWENQRHSSFIVEQYDLNGKLLNSFRNAKEAGFILGFAWQSIQKVCRGNWKQNKGYVFKYVK